MHAKVTGNQCNYNTKIPPSLFSPNPRIFSVKLLAGSSLGNTEDPPTLVGEDSAAFDLAKQKISSWIYFAGILGTVLFVLDVAWLDNSTGYGKAFIDAVSGLSDSHEVSLCIVIRFWSDDWAVLTK